MNKYLQDFATVESHDTKVLTFEDGVMMAEESAAVESIFKDLDAFVGAIELATPDMSEGTVEALSIVLGAPAAAIQDLAAIEEDGKVKEALAAVKKAIIAFGKWIKDNFSKFLDIFRETAAKNIATLGEFGDKGACDNDTDKNLKEYFKDNKDKLEKAMKTIELGKAGLFVLENGAGHDGYITGFDAEGAKFLLPDVQEEGEFFVTTTTEEVAEIKDATYDLKTVTKNFEAAIKKADIEADLHKQLKEASDAAEVKDDPKAAANAKAKTKIAKAMQGQAAVYTKALSAVTKAQKLCNDIKPKEEEK